jgi:phosphatidylglycerophosphatase A
MRRFFLTFAYTGLSPKAPGTVASFFALLLGVAIFKFISMQTLGLATIFIIIVGIREISVDEAHGGMHDDKSIVIDEVAGMWLALLLSSGTWLQIGLSFLFFRLFDIWKPSLIGSIDRNVKGGLGVMGDDILAGLCAGVCSAFVFHLVTLM